MLEIKDKNGNFVKINKNNLDIDFVREFKGVSNTNGDKQKINIGYIGTGKLLVLRLHATDNSGGGVYILSLGYWQELISTSKYNTMPSITFDGNANNFVVTIDSSKQFKYSLLILGSSF